MIIETLGYSEAIANFLPIVAITVMQAKAIFERDNNACIFPFEHVCKGKLSLHHIDGKEDEPENIVEVCRSAHWNHLHNGASEAEKEVWRLELKRIATLRTEQAKLKGWEFPID